MVDLDLFDKSWKIYSRNDAYPPQFICDGSVVKNSLVTVGCYVEGTVINSLLSNNVKIGKGAVVKDSVIFEGAVIEEGATVNYSIVADKVRVGKGATVGADKDTGVDITVVGENVNIKPNAVVESGKIIEKDVEE